MKSILFSLFLLFSIKAIAGSAEAIAYNDKIVTEQNNIGKKILDFSAAPNEASLAAIREQTDASLKELNQMKPYEGNKELLDAAKALFSFYHEVSENEYKEILAMLNNKDKYSNEEFTSKLNQLVTSISDKEKPLDERFSTAQKAFAGKYGFTLKDNDLQQELNNAGNGN